MYKIYVLKDPNTGNVRYVGMTKKTLEQRLAGHIRETGNGDKYEWINGLRETGQSPIIELIEKGANENKAITRERFWIDHYLQAGCDLLNYEHNPHREYITISRTTDERYPLLCYVTSSRATATAKRCIEDYAKRYGILPTGEKSRFHTTQLEKCRYVDRAYRMRYYIAKSMREGYEVVNPHFTNMHETLFMYVFGTIARAYEQHRTSALPDEWGTLSTDEKIAFIVTDEPFLSALETLITSPENWQRFTPSDDESPNK